jgi:hypothetical protein
MLSSITKWLKARARSRDSAAALPPTDAKSWYELHQEAVQNFWAANKVETAQRGKFILAELSKAIAAGDEDRSYLLIDVALKSDSEDKVDVLNELLLVKEHRRHQEVVREIQLLRNGSSVPYLRRVLEDGIDHLVEYNGSGSGVVAKWFSHALFDIGTPDAIRALEMFSAHSDAEIGNEMLYRLSKLSGSTKNA